MVRFFVFICISLCVSCSAVREIKVKDQNSPNGERRIKLGPQVQKKGVLFRVKAPQGTYSLSIAGSFNEWNPDNLRFFHDKRLDIWTLYLPLRAFGSARQVEFKYIRNGTEWMVDPLTSHVNDGYGGKNSILKLR